MNNIFILPTNTCFGIACPINETNSYNSIYKIKGREFNKPFSILCMDIKYLEKNTLLNKDQINFIKNYPKPYTILIKKNKILDKNLLKIIENLPNSKIYERIAFRTSHNFMHKKLIEKNGLLFLTSANKSKETETFSTKDIIRIFKKEIEKYNVKVFAHKNFIINSIQKWSDIFEFIWDSLEAKFLRKN